MRALTTTATATLQHMTITARTTARSTNRIITRSAVRSIIRQQPATARTTRTATREQSLRTRLIMLLALLLIKRRKMYLYHLLRLLLNLLLLHLALTHLAIQIMLSDRLAVYLLSVVNIDVLTRTRRVMMVSLYRTSSESVCVV